MYTYVWICTLIKSKLFGWKIYCQIIVLNEYLKYCWQWCYRKCWEHFENYACYFFLYLYFSLHTHTNKNLHIRILFLVFLYEIQQRQWFLHHFLNTGALFLPLFPLTWSLPPPQPPTHLPSLHSPSSFTWELSRTSEIMKKCFVVVVVLVAQTWLTLHNPRDYSPPGSSVHGILQWRME